MAGISNFTLSWWYSSNTKLALSFDTLGANIGNTLDSTTGMSSSIEENYHMENMITNHPVEDGTNISDHIIVQPKTITITGLLTAIKTLSLFGFNTGNGFLDFNYIGDAVKFLFDASKRRTTFTLSTGLYFGSDYYKINNVAIQSIDIPRNNQYGKTSIKFTMVLKEIVITNTDASNSNNKSTQGQIDVSNTGLSDSPNAAVA